ncbi:MAG: ABC transporter permease [Anaerolineaceae bacterium]|nr:MAG: ABC transporter permease [Anaerolineaceae bacterium]
MSKSEETAKVEKKSAISIFFEEVSQSSLIVPILAIISGLLLGGLLVALSSEDVYTMWTVNPLQAISNGFKAAWESYVTLFTGSFGSPSKIIAAIQSGEGLEIRRAINPIFESLVKSIPYIFAGLAVSLGFRTGLFNIGVEGQIFMGGIFSVWVGYSFTGLPVYIHLPFAFMAGALGGALWGFIPGFLKSKTGGHEVINTIMMNYIAFRLTDWLLREPMKREGSTNPLSPIIEKSAELPRFLADPIRFHLGFFIALAVALLVYWFLFKTKWGFDLRTVGANPHAARYAGMNIVRSTIGAMSLSGALAGMAGANELLGLNHHLSQSFSPGYGFDAIALALLGRNHPLGVVLASLLFGTLRNGATRMQAAAGIPIDIISVMQALILAFIAAPAIIRTIFRLKEPKEAEIGVRVSGWGGS